MAVRTHTDGIVGMVCAHADETVWKISWNGPGTENVYIGSCINEVGRLRTRITNPKFEFAQSRKDVVRIAQEILVEG